MKKLLALAAALALGLVDAQARYVKYFNTTAELVATSVRDVSRVAVVLEFDAEIDGGAVFYYDAASTAATNTTTVFAPTVGAGRWIRTIIPGSGLGGVELGDNNTWTGIQTFDSGVLINSTLQITSASDLTVEGEAVVLESDLTTALLPKQTGSLNLTNWSALATTSKQDASANLTNWSAIATTSKQDTNAILTALSTNTIAGTGTLVLSSVTTAKQDASATLTSLSTNTITGTGRIVLESEVDAGSEPNLDFWLEDTRSRIANLAMGGQDIEDVGTLYMETLSVQDLVVTNALNIGEVRGGTLVLTNRLNIASGGTGGTTPETARSALGVALDEDVQSYNPVLSEFAAAGSTGTGPFVRLSALGEYSTGIYIAGTNLISGSSLVNVWTNPVPMNTTRFFNLDAVVGGSTNAGSYEFRATIANQDGVGLTVGTNALVTIESDESMTAHISRSGTNAVVSVKGVPNENMRWSWRLTASSVLNATGGLDETPPSLSSAAISASGEYLNLVFDEAVYFGAGGSGGLALTSDGPSITVGSPLGSGSSTLEYGLSRTVLTNETLTLDYTQPGNGIEDQSGNDLASFSDAAVTNNSTQEAASGGCEVDYLTFNGTVSGYVGFGYTALRSYIAQKFDAVGNATICAASVLLTPKTGDPQFFIRAQVWSWDEATDRPLAAIGNASDAIYATSVSSTESEWVQFQNLSASVTDAGTYYLVLFVNEDSGSTDHQVGWSRYTASLTNSQLNSREGETWYVLSSTRIFNVILHTSE